MNAKLTYLHLLPSLVGWVKMKRYHNLKLHPKFKILKTHSLVYYFEFILGHRGVVVYLVIHFL